MPFCHNCGCNVGDGAKFCPECGTPLPENAQQTDSHASNVTSGIPCAKCGSVIPLGAMTCPACGSPLNGEKHTAAIVLGYIATVLCTLVFSPLGIIVAIIFAIYLGTRDNRKVRKHGIIMIILAIVIAIIMLAISYFAYMSYINSMNNYYDAYSSYSGYDSYYYDY